MSRLFEALAWILGMAVGGMAWSGSLPVAGVAGSGAALGRFFRYRWIVVVFGIWLVLALLGLEPGKRLLVHHLGLWAVLGWSLAAGVPRLCERYPVLTPLQMGLLIFPWIAALSAHRDGSLQRPYEWVDPWWARGYDVVTLFVLLGLVAATLAVASRLCLRWGNLLLIFLLAEVALGLLPKEKLALDFESSSGRAPVTRVKPAKPEAVVVFYQDYQPPSGYYYFRSNIASAAPPEGSPSETVQLRVAELTAEPLDLRFGLYSRPRNVTNPKPERFTRVYELVAQVNQRDLRTLLEQESDRPEPIEGLCYEMAQEIVGVEPQPSLRTALKIKLWLEENRTLDDQSQADLEAFLEEGLAGRQSTFAVAAQALMEARGLRVRGVAGYAVRADQRGKSSFLMLTDQNRRRWTEVWVEGVGWLAVDTFPVQGASVNERHQDATLQRRLGELARSSPPPPSDIPWSWFFYVVGLWWALGSAIKVGRELMPHFCDPHRVVGWHYILSLERLAEVGEIRRKGEPREAFAQRLADRFPSLGVLTREHLRNSISDRSGSQEAAARAALQLRQEIARAVPTGRRWLGYFRPFAWTRGE